MQLLSPTVCSKLVDSDFEDMQLVKSAMKRIKVSKIELDDSFVVI